MIYTAEVADRSQAVGSVLVRLLDSYGLESSTALVYLDALTVQDLDGCCTFGPTEVAVSFSADRRPTIRCLSEVVNKCSPDFPDITVAKLGNQIFERLARQGIGCDSQLLNDLIRITYSKQADTHRTLRFGVGMEWSAYRGVGIKCYFDLHSDGRHYAADRFAASCRRLTLDAQYARARELLGDRLKDGRCHGMATDLLPGIRVLRLYSPGSRWSLGELRELLAATDRSEQIDLLERYNTAVLGSLRSNEPLTHLLVSLVLTSVTGSEPILKLDAFMPALKPDDGASYETVCSLAESLKVPTEECAKAFEVFSDPAELSSSQRMLQYLSIDFVSAPMGKLNAYFRPPGIETEHMQPAVRPRRKPKLLCLLDEACRNAIRALERQRLTQYKEAVHRMVFPRFAGFSSPNELHLGDVFQRALIADALLDAERAGYLIDRRGLDDDVARLAGLRSSAGLRGWKYFPTLPELPPDADDLAQVIQVLQRVEYPDLGELVDPLLQVIAQSSTSADGSFETWIVDRLDESPDSELMRRFIKSHWGSGRDPEVIANMVYAMSIYDTDRYRSRIQDALRYLASRQQPDGSWPSTWYAGSNYATFVCTRALQVSDASHYSLYRASRFLADTLHSEGGWGPGAPNSGDTAYALRTCSLLGNGMVRRLIIPGLTFLLQQQQANGLWRASDFITMNTSRASNAPGGIILVYRSKTITTAACLSALCAIRPLVESE